MEDAVCVTSWESSQGVIDFYAVFDGHGGDEVSTFLQYKMHSSLKQNLDVAFASTSPPNIQQVLIQTFSEVNAHLRTKLMSQGLLHKVSRSDSNQLLKTPSINFKLSPFPLGGREYWSSCFDSWGRDPLCKPRRFASYPGYQSGGRGLPPCHSSLSRSQTRQPRRGKEDSGGRGFHWVCCL